MPDLMRRPRSTHGRFRTNLGHPRHSGADQGDVVGYRQTRQRAAARAQPSGVAGDPDMASFIYRNPDGSADQMIVSELRELTNLGMTIQIEERPPDQ
jgi:hypothetical protein